MSRVFGVKQKTAYELRISDWSSDVCSSDLDLLEREGFDGSYDAVRRYAARWKAERRKDAGDGVTAFIPLMFKPGEAYQFDWSHEDVEIAGKPMRVKVAHMRLCASRAAYVRAYPRESHEMLRSEARRVGEECVSAGKSRGSRYS